jgi:DNA modification methylase
MGATWDGFVPGPATWREVYRVLKPGATLLCFAGARTQDLMGISLRLAGFEVFDCLMWIYGQGFGGLGLNIGKALDKAAIVECPDCNGKGCILPDDEVTLDAIVELYQGEIDDDEFIAKVDEACIPDVCERCKGEGKVKGAEREVVGQKRAPSGELYSAKTNFPKNTRHEGWDRPWMRDKSKVDLLHSITAPATPEAALFEGYNSKLKPAYEPILCARKPMPGTYAENALRFGVSGLNIDGTRVETTTDDRVVMDNRSGASDGISNGIYHDGIGGTREKGEFWESNPQGRYPPNLLLECNCGAGQGGKHAPDCVCRMVDEDSGHLSSGGGDATRKATGRKDWGMGSKHSRTTKGGIPPNSGGASRFYPNLPADAARFKYSSKAPQKERAHYKHPTQKSEAVMDWLCRLLKMPEHNLILDPFAGTGTTAIAAIKNGMDYVMIEQDEEYFEAIKHRIATYTCKPYVAPKSSSKSSKPQQLRLW